MKLTVILLLSACLGAAAKTNAQAITLQVKNAPLEQVIKQLETQSGYTFVYTYTDLSQAKKVDLTVKDLPLTKVLELCFRDQPLSYEIIDKMVVLKPRPLPPNISNGTSALLIDVSGRIVDENGEAVVASVQVKGTNKGTSTNAKGEFSISGVEDNSILQITGVSIEPMEVKINGRSNINLTAKKKIAALEEVIVKKGYYDEKKALSTGNVSTVTYKDIEKQPIANPLLAIQGRVAGAVINSPSGLPGAAMLLTIRGSNSLTNGNTPLYILDGVPLPAKPNINSSSQSTVLNGAQGAVFSYINPADIESISILKDADATAIYGTRGANGVVLITTKKGKAGNMRFDLTVQQGFSDVPRKMDMLNTAQYLEMRQEALKNDGLTANPNADYDLTLWSPDKNTDWQDELIGGTASFTDVQAAVSGGNETAQYRIGAGYMRQTSVFPTDKGDKKNFASFQLSGASPDKKMRVSLSGQYTINDGNLPSYDLTPVALSLAPNSPNLYNADGSVNWALNAAGNSTWIGLTHPLGYLLRNFNNQNRLLNSSASVSYQPIKGLEAELRGGYSHWQNDQLTTIPLSSWEPALRPSRERSSNVVNNRAESWIVEPQLRYQRGLGKNSVVSVQAGLSFQQSTDHARLFTAQGFNSDQVMDNISAATQITGATEYQSLYRRNGAIARINYNYQDKYIVNLTGSRDGSSRFSPANRYENFWAAGAAWLFHKEGFIRDHFPVLSFGKLRVSYGTTGSDQVPDYGYLDLYSPIPNPGLPYQGVIGYQPTRLFTPDLQWELTRKLELGLALGFLRDRIRFEASAYQNRSSNQLLSIQLPFISGFPSIQQNLSAVVQNSGLELELSTVNIQTRHFTWTSSLNLTLSRNKFLSAEPSAPQYIKDMVGYPVGSYRNLFYHYTGVNIITGYYEFADKDGKPTQTPSSATDQRTFVDATPRYYGGLLNSLQYKGLQLDFLFRFAKKTTALPRFEQPGSFSGFAQNGTNQPVSVLQRWREPGDVSQVQRFTTLDAPGTTAFYQSDAQFGDGSFVRLQNVSLSWQAPDQWKKLLGLQQLRVFAQGQNLFVITDYPGLDPEGVFTSLPPLRTIVLGVQVSL